ncbi:hypothetical protein SynMITS9220_00624 [Synechococcus sp. MIT S9220]|nr:hypothetical protein SynMITS9220_00624 [Synechococcus sp. MIT S9220]
MRGRSIRCGYLYRWVGSRSLPLSHLFDWFAITSVGCLDCYGKEID